MTAELFTVATQETAGLQRLQSSLAKFEVPITLLGQDQAVYWGHCWKWKTFINKARESTAETVAYCDGFDSLCLAPIEAVLTKFELLDHPIIFSYAAQEQPEFWLGLQPGLVIANRQALLDAFDDKTLDALFPDHFNDQYQLQSLYSWNPDLFKLDREGVLFHTFCPGAPELVVQENKLINPATGNSPSFVHGPHGWDLSAVEQWLVSQN